MTKALGPCASVSCELQTVTLFPVERTGNAMTSNSVLIVDMSILVGIFLLGLLAKLFPRRQETREQGTGKQGLGTRG